jgi:hypothetical protein
MVQASYVIFESAPEGVVEGNQIQDGMKESAVFSGIKQTVAISEVDFEKVFDVALFIWVESISGMNGWMDM